VRPAQGLSGPAKTFVPAAGGGKTKAKKSVAYTFIPQQRIKK
jgi:hypothetical protein